MTMWMWVMVFVVVATVILLAQWMDRRRGSQGTSRSSDLPGTKDGRPRHIDTVCERLPAGARRHIAAGPA